MTIEDRKKIEKCIEVLDQAIGTLDALPSQEVKKNCDYDMSNLRDSILEGIFNLRYNVLDEEL